jgi:hypothetical protein
MPLHIEADVVDFLIAQTLNGLVYRMLLALSLSLAFGMLRG